LSHLLVDGWPPGMNIVCVDLSRFFCGIMELRMELEWTLLEKFFFISYEMQKRDSNVCSRLLHWRSFSVS